MSGARLILDVTVSFVSIVLLLLGIRVLSKRMGIDWVPAGVGICIFFAVGAALHLPGSPLSIPSDGAFYLEWGRTLSEIWVSEASNQPLSPSTERELWPGKGAWPLLIAMVTYVFGSVSLIFIAINSCLMGASIVLLQVSAKLLCGKDLGRIIALFWVSSPPFLLFGPSVLRESIFWFGISSWVVSLALMRQNREALSWLAAGVGSIVLLAIRPDAGLVLSYGFAFVLLTAWGFLLPKPSNLRRVLVLICLPTLLFAFPSVLEILRPETTPESLNVQARSLSHPSVTTSFAHNSAWTNLEESCGARYDSTLVTAACQSFENLPRAVFGPFIGEYGTDLVWIVAGAAGLHFLIIVALAISYGLSRNGKNWVSLGLGAVGLISLLLFASILTNYGILIRFRAGTEIILMALSAQGLSQILQNKSTVL